MKCQYCNEKKQLTEYFDVCDYDLMLCEDCAIDNKLK